MIETERLRIVPLSPGQLKKYLLSDGSLEAEMGLDRAERYISPDLAEAFETSILPNTADPGKNYLYYTLWAIVSKKESKIVAGLLFTGEPNESGEAEIGYGTEPEFQNQGYMTEAIGGIIRWAEQKKEIRSIIAQTDKTNLPSHKTLEKNGFLKYKTDEDKIGWQKIIV